MPKKVKKTESVLSGISPAQGTSTTSDVRETGSMDTDEGTFTVVGLNQLMNEQGVKANVTLPKERFWPYNVNRLIVGGMACGYLWQIPEVRNYLKTFTQNVPEVVTSNVNHVLTSVKNAGINDMVQKLELWNQLDRISGGNATLLAIGLFLLVSALLLDVLVHAKSKGRSIAVDGNQIKFTYVPE